MSIERSFRPHFTGWVGLVLWVGLVSVSARAADRPVAIRWDFGAEETTPLVSHGGVHRDVPGPRPPIYPDFDARNTAIKLDGQGAYLSFEDPGAQSDFDYTNGEAITLEAWVQVETLHGGENVYVIGKGRTGSPGFAADNQNWALRVREVGGKAGISFLFATPRASGGGADSHWHRWTTKSGFTPGKTWHHIAASYKFGEPESIRGWIDGKPQPGVWDMGGTTVEAPVVDNDAIWIGSSRGGAAGNSFRGYLDSVVIHHEALTDAVMAKRYRREGEEIVTKPAPEVAPEIENIPPGKVLLSLHEGMPAHNRWLNEGEMLPRETLRVPLDYSLLDRLPQRFDDWGIRENWKAPTLARLSADVQLSPGTHRFLFRVRGLSRLWVNGTIVARSKPLGGSPSGEEPITPVAEPPLPGLRIAEHRQQEITGEATVSADGRCRIVLETLVGGKDLRTDPGEVCLTVQSIDAKTYTLVAAAGSAEPPVELTDEAITRALSQTEAALIVIDIQNRRAAAQSQAAFWEQRHAVARAWAELHPAPTVPALPATPDKAPHPIDAFLRAKQEQALQAAAQTPIEEARRFHSTVLPILRDNCFRCHGDKENGGLQLHTREAALQAGDSESPALVPGHADQSELLRRIKASDPDERMPPGLQALKPEQIAALEAWINAGAEWPAPPVTAEDVALPPTLNDFAFMRRVYLDTVGVPPTEAEVRAFTGDSAADKRPQLIDRLLADERWADHWVSYWQDVLAENPTLINPSLNTTGPFRWFLYDSLLDDKPLDRIVTELILLRGSPHEGGSAGFGIAADNDAPYAAKGQIVANAFLGIELQCARCHDSPYHSTMQKDLYSLAAMFEQKPVTVPKTSRVPAAFFEKKMRESLIRATLNPDEPVPPAWPFAEVTGCADGPEVVALMQKPESTREKLAALITAPQNTRFSQVVVNRIWRRLMGAGFVEPPHDWEGHAPSHPELLQWLAHQFVRDGYDMKQLARTILTSEAYQRVAVGHNRTASADLRFFVAPDRRRLTAEQVVDGLYQGVGQRMDLEELTFDPDGRRASSNRLTLGVPRRAWMLASLANERDRPSLGLQKARAITDIMEAFGWTGSRQSPRTDRETDPNVLQPGVLANSTASVWLTRAAEGSELADLAVQATSPDTLVDSVFLRYLGRLPTEEERHPLAVALAGGFTDRIVPEAERPTREPLPRLPRVTWSNHLRPEATTIAMELEIRARTGPPPDRRLRDDWREAYEDVVWSVVNIREFVWLP